MATPSKGIMRPVMNTETARMLRLAQEGMTIREIMEATGRSKGLVTRICRGIARPAREKGRMLTVLAIWERSRKPPGVLACDLGYANARSLQSTVSQAKRIRAEMSEGQRPCL